MTNRTESEKYERRQYWGARAEALYRRLSWFRQKMLKWGIHLRVGMVQFQPDNPHNPRMPLFLFWCNEPGPDIDRIHGYDGSPSCRIGRARWIAETFRHTDGSPVVVRQTI
jgi:hypothetical protein